MRKLYIVEEFRHKIDEIVLFTDIDEFLEEKVVQKSELDVLSDKYVQILLREKDFLKRINSLPWNGYYYSVKVLDNRESFITKVIENPKWNGSYFNFGELLKENREFMIKIIESERWNGHYYSLRAFDNDLSFMSKIITSPKWDGSYCNFGKIIKDDKEFMIRVIKSPRWNGYFYPIKKLGNDKRFIEKLIKQRKWDGNYDNFGRLIKRDKEFMKTVEEFHKQRLYGYGFSYTSPLIYAAFEKDSN